MTWWSSVNKGPASPDPRSTSLRLPVFDALQALAVFLNAVSKGGERECLATFLTSGSRVSCRPRGYRNGSPPTSRSFSWERLFSFG